MSAANFPRFARTVTGTSMHQRGSGEKDTRINGLDVAGTKKFRKTSIIIEPAPRIPRHGTALRREERNATRASISAGFKVPPNAGMFTPPFTIRITMLSCVNSFPM